MELYRGIFLWNFINKTTFSYIEKVIITVNDTVIEMVIATTHYYI